MNYRQASSLVVLAALFSLAASQSITNQTAYYKKFLGCVSASPNNYYCPDGTCYNGSQPGCTNNFTLNYTNEALPATYTYDYDINHLNIVSLPIAQANQSWIKIAQGETVRLNLKSTADKSAYIEIVYNKLNGTQSDNVNRTDNKNVLFYVYNDRLKNQRTFDMTNVNKVLLPQSSDDFTAYLAANKGDFNVSVLASNSLIGKAIGLAVSIFALAFAIIL